MKWFIKLLQAWKDSEGKQHKKGTVLEVDEDTYKELTEGDEAVAQKWSDELQKEFEAEEAERRKELADTIGSVLKDNLPDSTGLHITVHDKSDDDPVGGYLPQRIDDKYTPAELKRAFGQFALDVHAAKTGTMPERMVKARERSEAQVKDAVSKGLIRAEASSKTIVASQDSDGAFLIPTAVAALVIEGAQEESIVRQRAASINLSTMQIELPMARDEDHSNGLLYGGVLAYWTAEEEQLTESKPKFDKLAVGLNKLTCLGKVSGEMIKWSPASVGSWLMPMFQQALTWKEDGAFLTGTGAGMPLGMLNSPNVIAISKEGGQVANTIVAQNILNMWTRLRKLSAAGAFWMTNEDCFPQLAQMKLDIGTGGVALWTPADGLAGRPYQTLMGLPLFYSERIPTVGTKNDLCLINPSRYLVADDTDGPEIAQSIHLDFDRDRTAYRIIKYSGGTPLDKKPFTPEKGSTKSPFIVIEDRN